MHRKLRLGMIGGGAGAFIGAVHRIAARLDNEYELVCGVFSSNAKLSAESGAAAGLAADRVYSTYQEMISAEQLLDPSLRMEVMAIVTPNHLHAAPAILAMESGFHVVMDKPMTLNFTEAKQLEAAAHSTGRLFCLTHTYTGYPMVKEAKQLISQGKLGTIRKVYVEYPQGWLSTALEKMGNKQAEWRSDPKRNGDGGALGDIGTHAFNLAEYVSGLEIEQLCAAINTVVEGRKLDDDTTILLKFSNGASGVLFATQVAAGEENNIKIRVYGEKGGVEWEQADANSLWIKWLDKPAEQWRAGANKNYLSTFALHNCRTPGGHPEGYLEAFANHYRNFALTVKAFQEGREAAPEWLDYPGITEGVRGMAFVETALTSGSSDQKWTDLKL